LRIKTLISPINPSANASPLQLKIDFCKRSIENSEKFLFVTAYPYKDWLRVWSYFAKRGNTKAIAVLRGLAQYGLEAYL